MSVLTEQSPTAAHLLITLPNGKQFIVAQQDMVVPPSSDGFAPKSMPMDESTLLFGPPASETLLLDVTPWGEVFVFDPLKHPHGFKGKFVATHTVHDLDTGDVFHTKSGKVFQVEKHTDSGTKVKTVDPTTGQLKGGYTVLSHQTPVKVVETAKKVGSEHQVGDLTPGTYVTTKKGKKFVIHAHGKWTTLYPVDNQGTKSGKHTVLPKTTVVTIHNPDTVPATAESAAQVNEAGDEFKATQAALQYLNDIGATVDEQDAVAQSAHEWHSSGTPWPMAWKLAAAGHGSLSEVGGQDLQQTIEKALAPVVKPGPSTDEVAKMAAQEFMDGAGVGAYDQQTVTANAVALHEGKYSWPDAFFHGWEQHVGSDPSFAGDLYQTVKDVLEGHLVVTPSPSYKKGDLVVWTAPGGPSSNEYSGKTFTVTEDQHPQATGIHIEIPGDPDSKGFPTLDQVKPAPGPELGPEWAKAAVAADKQTEEWGWTHEQSNTLAQKAQEVYAADKTVGQLKGAPELAWGTAYLKALHDSIPGGANEQAGHKLFAEVAKAIAPDSGYATYKPPEHMVAEAVSQTMTAWLQGPGGQMAPDVAAGIVSMATELHQAGSPWASSFKHAFEESWHTEMEDEYYGQMTEALLAALHPLKNPAQAPPPGATPLHPIAVAQAVQEKLPTNFPVKQPQPYEEGVGKDTKIVIRASHSYQSGGASILRVTADGHEQLLEHHDVVKITQLRNAARAHAGAHEAIHEETMTYRPVKQDWQVGDMVVTPLGSRYRVAEVVPGQDGQVLLKTHSVNTSTTWVSTFDPQHAAYMRIPQGYAEPLDWQEGKKMFEEWAANEPSAIQITPGKTVRKAHPEKYSEFLKSGWDPEQLIGQPRRAGVEAFKALGYREIQPRKKGALRFINKFGARVSVAIEKDKITAVDQPKIEQLHIDGTAQDLHQRLAEVLDTGGDLESLDPRSGSMPEATTSFVRNLLYDMAVGKKNGVNQGGAKVKSDEAYRQELEAEGHVPDLAESVQLASVGAPPIKIVSTAPKQMLAEGTTDPHFQVVNPNNLSDPEAGTYELEHPEQLSANARAILYAGLKRRGIAQMLLDRDKQDLAHAAKMLADEWAQGKLEVPAPEGSPFASMAAYVADNVAHWSQISEPVFTSHQAAIQESAKALQREFVQDLIDERRAEEGTVKSAVEDYQLPTWDSVEFKPQTYDDIWNLMTQDTAGREVPAFYNGGVFEDGVLMHGRSLAGDLNGTYGKVPLAFDGQATQRLQMAGAQDQPNSDTAINNLQGSYGISAGRSLFLQDGPGKTIEYIYHNQMPGNAGGAPTSQRGVLRMVGYSPQEAAERLQALGLLGELEPTVPFDALMRGPRRYGTVDAILSDYVRGEAPLPKAKQLLVHGVQHTGNMEAIIRSGGLKSIATRWRLGIHQFGVSPSGDMRSGIDHAVFTNYGSGAVGSGAQIRILLRPSAFLRRDIVLSETDYGGSETRYPKYRNYLNGLQSKLGEQQTNLYAPVSPTVRQTYLTGEYLTSSAEHNIGPSIPIEDWEVIGVGSPAQKDQIVQLLESLLASGEIKAIPKVVSLSELPTLQRKVNME